MRSKTEGIDGCIIIGGDGSFRGAQALTEESDIAFIGVPGTIDNDVWGSDYTIGFNTAVNTALDAIDRIRDTASAFERIFFVEVMGKKSGFIALSVGLAGGAEQIIIPEIATDIEDLCRNLQESFKRGKMSSIIVVAEGNTLEGTINIAKYVEMRLKVESRLCTLGHVQRGGSPSAADRILASILGIAAVEGLLDGKEGTAVGQVKGEVVYTPFKDTWEKKKSIDEHFLKIIPVLSI